MSVEISMRFMIRLPTSLACSRSVCASRGSGCFGVVSGVAHGVLGARKLPARASALAHSLPGRPSRPGTTKDTKIRVCVVKRYGYDRGCVIRKSVETECFAGCLRALSNDGWLC